MDRILLTGGSGFVGQHLIRRLQADRPHVEIHNLDLVPSGLPVVEHLGSIEDESSYVSVPRVDAVIHLAAVSREPGYPVKRYYDVNNYGTSVLSDWLVHSSVPQTIFFSSISVYGSCEEPTSENSRMYPETPYGMSKMLAESRLRSWQNENDTSLAILRPGVIFGPGDDGNFPRLAKAVRQGWFMFPGRTDTRKAAIFVHDLADLVAWLLEYPYKSIAVNAVYERASTIEEIVAYLQKALGKPRIRTLVLPESLARAGVNILGLFESHRPPAERMFHARRIDKLVSSTNIISHTLPELPFSFVHTMESALEEWLGEYS